MRFSRSIMSPRRRSRPRRHPPVQSTTHLARTAINPRLVAMATPVTGCARPGHRPRAREPGRHGGFIKASRTVLDVAPQFMRAHGDGLVAVGRQLADEQLVNGRARLAAGTYLVDGHSHGPGRHAAEEGVVLNQQVLAPARAAPRAARCRLGHRPPPAHPPPQKPGKGAVFGRRRLSEQVGAAARGGRNHARREESSPGHIWLLVHGTLIVTLVRQRARQPILAAAGFQPATAARRKSRLAPMLFT